MREVEREGDDHMINKSAQRGLCACASVVLRTKQPSGEMSQHKTSCAEHNIESR